MFLRGYRRLALKNVWNGIDMTLEWVGCALKYGFYVNVGANPSKIRLRVVGADKQVVNPDGSLTTFCSQFTLHDASPISFQKGESLDRSDTIRSAFAIVNHELRLSLKRYDTNRPIVIDPTLLWSTYFGGSGEGAPEWCGGGHHLDATREIVSDAGGGICRDTAGNIYVAGRTGALDFR